MKALKLTLLMLYWFLIALFFCIYSLPRIIRRLYNDFGDTWYEHIISVYDDCKRRLYELQKRKVH